MHPVVELAPDAFPYAIADPHATTLQPDGPGRQSSAPARPMGGVIALTSTNSFSCLGAFTEEVAPIAWGYRATLDALAVHVANEAHAAGVSALDWRTWTRPARAAEQQRRAETWYAWFCDRWPSWRAHAAERARPTTLTIPEEIPVTQTCADIGGTRISLRPRRRDALVIGREDAAGPWRPIGPVEWLPAGTWPSVVHFAPIDHADGSWTSVVHPIIEAPAWPATPLVLPGGIEALRAWAECLPGLAAANHGLLSSHAFWTGCWNSLAGLPPMTGLWMNPPVSARPPVARR